MASSMCRTKNRSYFLARKTYTDVPIIKDMMMMDFKG
jgi:hypothetical protein